MGLLIVKDFGIFFHAVVSREFFFCSGPAWLSVVPFVCLYFFLLSGPKCLLIRGKHPKKRNTPKKRNITTEEKKHPQKRITPEEKKHPQKLIYRNVENKPIAFLMYKKRKKGTIKHRYVIMF